MTNSYFAATTKRDIPDADYIRRIERTGEPYPDYHEPDDYGPDSDNDIAEPEEDYDD
jgi:hypothetical protein